MKKIISSIISCGLLLTSIPLTSFADEAGTFDDLRKSDEYVIRVVDTGYYYSFSPVGRNMDYNGDGTVNIDDAQIFLSYLTAMGGYGDEEYWKDYKDAFEIIEKEGDIIEDGVIDNVDLMRMLDAKNGNQVEFTPGDANLDGRITGSDATAVLRAYTLASSK